MSAGEGQGIPGDTPGEEHEPRPDDVGSVSEEALKLFGALAGWATDQGADWGRGLADVATAAGDSAQDFARHLDEGIATGSAECRYCPICRTVHLARELSPEVREHLASAASSLLQAAAGILAAVSENSRPSTGGATASRGGVERIDLDADDETEPEPDQPDGTPPT